MRLWDGLAKNGVWITGDGDSDCHGAADAGWTIGNNFCSFAQLYNKEEPTEENFVTAFKRGSIWFGDPVWMRNLTFYAKQAQMGGVCVGERARVHFASTDIQTDG